MKGTTVLREIVTREEPLNIGIANLNLRAPQSKIRFGLKNISRFRLYIYLLVFLGLFEQFRKDLTRTKRELHLKYHLVCRFVEYSLCSRCFLSFSRRRD